MNAPKTVRYGDHLFISGDTNFVNEQHQGHVQIDDQSRTAWLSLLHARREFAGAHAAEFVFVLAPDKQTIYRHLLPERFRCRQAQFMSSLDFVLDPATLLSNVAKLTDVYPRTDSHWNHLGAYLTSEILTRRLGIHKQAPVIQWHQETRPGDLGHKLEPTERSSRLIAKISGQSDLLYDNRIPNNGRIRIWSKRISVSGSPIRTLLFFGDSFAYDLVYFLKEAFDVVVHVHSFSLDLRLVERLRPGTIVGEITERFVLRVPDPPDGPVLDSLWAQKVRNSEPFEPTPPDLCGPHDPAAYPREAVAAISEAEQMFFPFWQSLGGRSV